VGETSENQTDSAMVPNYVVVDTAAASIIVVEDSQANHNPVEMNQVATAGGGD
jgi:hypothetical protein